MNSQFPIFVSGLHILVGKLNSFRKRTAVLILQVLPYGDARQRAGNM